MIIFTATVVIGQLLLVQKFQRLELFQSSPITWICRSIFFLFLVISVIIHAMKLRCLASMAIASTLTVSALAQQGWLCYGGNAQHSGVWTGTSQTAALIKWATPLDDDRPYYGGDVLAHYAAPMVTPTNTVVYGYRFTVNSNRDNWRVMGRSGKSGLQTWSFDTDYSAAVIWPNDWTSVFPLTLFHASGPVNNQGIAAAALGGSLMIRSSADAASNTVKRIAFYTTAADFQQNSSSYAPIKINTPLTADSAGNIYFGYEVTSAIPQSLAALGTGGIAKVNAATGTCLYKSVQSLGIDSSLSRPGMNCAPALSIDGNYIYVGLVGGNGSMLVKLDVKKLNPSAQVKLIDPDPAQNGGGAGLINESSASPMVGPDGHVFMGVFGASYRESHGWMLQFDGNLSTKDSSGTAFPVGAFGWDDTASVVPSTMVPSYKGKAKYLICTKYNNYDMGGDPGADGSNRVAVLDPTSNSKSLDRQSKIPVMNEILTVLGPTLIGNDPNHPDARNEWCINSVAIDVNRKSAIINSEDGHMYRWSFVTGAISEALDLQPATGEAYTETAIGPDGQLYAINNSILCALGSNLATTVSVFQGTYSGGRVDSIQYLDGTNYLVKSVKTTSGQAAFTEADFMLSATNPTTINIVSAATGVAGVNGSIQLYTFQTKKFDTIANQALTGSQSSFNASVTSNVGQYIGPNGKIRVVVGGVLSPNISSKQFLLSCDIITCGLS